MANYPTLPLVQGMRSLFCPESKAIFFSYKKRLKYNLLIMFKAGVFVVDLKPRDDYHNNKSLCEGL